MDHKITLALTQAWKLSRKIKELEEDGIKNVAQYEKLREKHSKLIQSFSEKFLNLRENHRINVLSKLTDISKDDDYINLLPKIRNYIQSHSPLFKGTKTRILNELKIVMGKLNKNRKLRGGEYRIKQFKKLISDINAGGEPLKKNIVNAKPKTKGSTISKFLLANRILNPVAFTTYDRVQLKAYYISEIAKTLNKIRYGKVVNITSIDLYTFPDNSEKIIYTKTINFRIPKGSTNMMNIAQMLYKSIDREEAQNEIEEKSSESTYYFTENLGIDINIASFSTITGGKYMRLNKVIPKGKIRLFVNVKNSDNQCFKWASLASLYHKNLKEDEKENPQADDENSYKKWENEIDFSTSNFPFKVSELNMKKLEEKNPSISWNIYAYDGKEKEFYPIYTTSFNKIREKYIDILYFTRTRNSHYCAIKDIGSLFHNSGSEKKIICRRCLNNIPKSDFEKHKLICDKMDAQQIIMPSSSTSKFKKFKNIHKEIKNDFVIYADFEAFLQNGDDELSGLMRKEKYHKIASAFYRVVGNDKDFNKNSEIFTGENLIERFLNSLRIEAVLLASKSKNFKFQKYHKLTSDQKEKFEKEKYCMVCKQDFLLRKKNVSYDVKGRYNGCVCHECMNANLKKFVEIPVFFHNLKSYDGHHIIKAISNVLNEGDKIELISENYEKYKCITWVIAKGVKIIFKDSLAFLPSSLNNLVSNLVDENLKDKFPNLFEVYGEDAKYLCKKGIFPYSWFDEAKKLDYISLPPSSEFYDELGEEEITEESYKYAQFIWDKFKCKKFGDYHDIYLKTDVLLLADIFENFRNISMKYFKLDPSNYITLPSLSEDALYKTHGKEVELITDLGMLIMTERAIRGGLSKITKRHGIANNPYMSEYDKKAKDSYLIYVDINNQYGHGMRQKLPLNDYKWEDDKFIKNLTTSFIMNYDIDKEDRGYIIDCDLIYPKKLHDEHRDYPLAPEKMLCDKYGKTMGKYVDALPKPSEKLVSTLYDKKNYVVHISLLGFYLKHGLVLDKINKAYSFHHDYLYKEYIDKNTASRIKAKNSFEKDFYKLCNNAVYGKSLQNPRKFEDIKILTSKNTDEKMMKKQIQRLTNSPLFENFKLMDDDGKLIVIKSKKKNLKFDNPIAIGFTILELSKKLLYEIHYDYFMKKYKRENIEMIFTDTDSLIYEIKTKDFYDDILKDKRFYDIFDFSNFPVDHPLYDIKNKALIGKIKIETGSDIMTEFVGLRSKMYAYTEEKGGGCKKGKGIKRVCLKKHIKFEDYKNVLFGNLEDGKKQMMVKAKGFRSFNHEIFTVSQTKIGLSGFDDKRYVCKDMINTLPWGHYLIKDEDYIIRK